MENEQLINELADRIFNLLDPWEKDIDKTEQEQKNEIFNEITTQPEYTIKYLLDIIDNYTA